MDEEQKNPPVFPPEFAHLEQPLIKLKSELAVIDQQLAKLPKEKGSTLDFRPPGEGRPPDFTLKTRQTLLKESYERKQAFLDLVDKEAEKTTPKSGKLIKEIASHQLSGNQFADKLLQLRPDLERASPFDRAEAIYFSNAARPNEPRPEPKKQETIDDWSDRFLKVLNANRQELPSNLEDIEPDKED